MFVDFETAYIDQACRPALNDGLWSYASATYPIVAAWGLGDEPIKHFIAPSYDDLTAAAAEFRADAARATTICAHNSQFDATVWDTHQASLGPRPGQAVCTMALARLMSLPGSLEGCSQRAFGEGKTKDPNGQRLKDMVKEGRPLSSQDLLDFADYCVRDTDLCRGLWKVLWPVYLDAADETYGSAWDDFALDETINRTGLPVDPDLARAAIARGSAIQAEADQVMANTMGDQAVPSSSVLRALRWLNTNLPRSVQRRPEDIGKSRTDIEMAMRACSATRPDLLPVAEALSSTSFISVKKWEAVLKHNYGGRVNSAFVFAGAISGRWTSKGLQAHNFPRSGGERYMVQSASPSQLSELLRHVVKAPAGRRLVVSDFAQIELRVALALAGEREAHDAAAGGHDLYRATACHIFGKRPEEIGYDERQTAKTAVLSLGYGTSLRALAEKLGMSPHSEVAKSCYGTYHRLYPRVSQTWRACSDALYEAVNGNLGRVAYCRMFKPKGVDAVAVRLPSGRPLFYHNMRATSRDNFSWSRPTGGQAKLWGSAMFQNLCQAVARDILAEAMTMFHHHEYRPASAVIVGHVHDEIIVEVDEADAAYAVQLLEWCMGSTLAAGACDAAMAAETRIVDSWGDK